MEKNNKFININYNKQQQIDLGNYGITGNLPPFDDNLNIQVSINGNLNFCEINGNKAYLNQDLLGQIMVIILHEYRHIMQRIGNIDEKILMSINSFESKCKSDNNYYVDNYADDPAEIDANLNSFTEFNNISKMFGVYKPDQVIINKVTNVLEKSEKSFNLYKDINELDINTIYDYLSERLENSILEQNYSNKII